MTTLTANFLPCASNYLTTVNSLLSTVGVLGSCCSGGICTASINLLDSAFSCTSPNSTALVCMSTNSISGCGAMVGCEGTYNSTTCTSSCMGLIGSTITNQCPLEISSSLKTISPSSLPNVQNGLIGVVCNAQGVCTFSLSFSPSTNFLCLMNPLNAYGLCVNLGDKSVCGFGTVPTSTSSTTTSTILTTTSKSIVLSSPTSAEGTTTNGIRSQSIATSTETTTVTVTAAASADQTQNSGLPIATIAGAAVGGLVAILIFIIVMVLIFRKKKNKTGGQWVNANDNKKNSKTPYKSRKQITDGIEITEMDD